jgi:hypothetical protein
LTVVSVVLVLSAVAAQVAPAGIGQNAENSIEQNAGAGAMATQVAPLNHNAPVTTASGNVRNGAVNQENENTAYAKAFNINSSSQQIDQQKLGKFDSFGKLGTFGKLGSPGGSCGGKQKAENEIEQNAFAGALANQVAPINMNAPVTVAAGNVHQGTVNQENENTAKAKAFNINSSSQQIDQSCGKGSMKHFSKKPDGNRPDRNKPDGNKPGGGSLSSSSGPGTGQQCETKTKTIVVSDGPSGGSSQSISQSGGGYQKGKNEIEQNAFAGALANQVAPININAPVTVAGGNVHQGNVNQENENTARAKAFNVNGASPKAGKTHTETVTVVVCKSEHKTGPAKDKGTNIEKHSVHKTDHSSTQQGGSCTSGNGSGGGSQSAKNEIEQNAFSGAAASQTAPVNINAPVTVAGGNVDQGNVNQSNENSAHATAFNSNSSRQSICQSQAGHDSPPIWKPSTVAPVKSLSPVMGSSAYQHAENEIEQNAVAGALANQVAPTNLNAPVTVAGGNVHQGNVNQENENNAAATAINVNSAQQDISQTQTQQQAVGQVDHTTLAPVTDGNSGQTQTAENEVEQNAGAGVVATQTAPTNTSTPVTTSAGNVTGGTTSQENENNTNAVAGNVDHATQQSTQSLLP